MQTPAPNEDLLQKRRELAANSRHLAGAGPAHAAVELERIAAFLRANELRPDNYGTGAVVEEFEREVATLLGKQAARFMPSGCMAQPIALRIWAERAQNFHVAFHATSHLELHEERGYAELHGLEAILLGDPTRPTLAQDLEGLPPISTLLVELPAREIGGQMPSWDQLVELTDAARARGFKLHLDGARLWEAQVGYGRPFAEVCALFDSVYVSFYKGIGALSGAMLLGPADFIEEAAVWQRRQGGTLYSALANIVSAQPRVSERLARLPLDHARARGVAALFAATPGVRVLPEVPQVNMFHVFLTGDKEALELARDRVAESHGFWLFHGLRADGEELKFELTIGESALSIPDGELTAALAALMA